MSDSTQSCGRVTAFPEWTTEDPCVLASIAKAVDTWESNLIRARRYGDELRANSPTPTYPSALA